MALQLSVSARNALLDVIETTIGTSAVLKIRTGSPPATCGDADSGTVLATLTLPSDWMNAASAGSKTKLGTWEDASADAGGTAGHFRLYESTGATCYIQGTITATSGGGDMELSTVTIAAGDDIVINTFTLTAANS